MKPIAVKSPLVPCSKKGVRPRSTVPDGAPTSAQIAKRISTPNTTSLPTVSHWPPPSLLRTSMRLYAAVASTARPSTVERLRNQGGCGAPNAFQISPSASTAYSAKPRAYKTPATMYANQSTQPTTNAARTVRTFFANV